jgi:hypothetical protein
MLRVFALLVAVLNISAHANSVFQQHLDHNNALTDKLLRRLAETAEQNEKTAGQYEESNDTVELRRSATDHTTNFALRKPATQSSVAYGAEASRAVDGNTNGKWSSGSCTATSLITVSDTDTLSIQNSHPWWGVDLGAVAAIEKVTLYNRADCCGSRLDGFSVRLSDENHPGQALHGAETRTKSHPRGALNGGLLWSPGPLCIYRRERKGVAESL